MKYKVGDKVILGTDGGSNKGKDKLVGKIGVISATKNWNDTYPYVMIPDNGYGWRESELTPYIDSKVVITVNGNETLARLYKGNEVIKSASAKCSPEDTFDFSVGAKIAFERLMGIEPKNEEKPKSETESTSKFKFEVGQKYSVKGLIGANSGVIEITKVDGQRVYWKTLKGMEDWAVSKSFDVGSYFADCCTLVETIYKPGDKVKVICDDSGPRCKVGDIITLKDDNVNQSLFPEDSHKWHYEENSGYICESDVEPYVELEFKVGDLVKITDCGHRYTTYSEWVEKNASEYLNAFSKHSAIPRNDEVGVIRKIAPHGIIRSDGDICLVEFSKNRVILIGHKGIEKA